jgi:hypothetical protein
MEEQLENLPAEPRPKRNRGWFRPGDRRINREGRPLGSKALLEEGSPAADRAPCADRLMLLVVSGRDLAFRLSHHKGPVIVNLPADAQVVACRVDAARDAVALVIRSQEFPRIARGAPVPEFMPRFEGLRWRRG